MKVTVLGCSGSLGVPVIGCSCAVCTSDDPRNTRCRSCVAIETDEGNTVFIDTPPDFRQQVLKYGYKTVHDVLYTHVHADHTHGIDDLRALDAGYASGKINVWSDEYTLTQLSKRFPNLFMGPLNVFKGTQISVAMLKHYSFTNISNVDFFSFPQPHGRVISNGLVFGNVGYCTDLSDLPSAAIPMLKRVETLFIECLGYEDKAYHLNFDRAVAIIEKLSPKRVFTIHMGHNMDYEGLHNRLRQHFETKGIDAMPAYDGLTVDVSMVYA